MTEMIAAIPTHPISSITDKAHNLGFSQKYIKPNNGKFKAVYQDYDWCFDCYINKGMTMQEMANLAGCKLRVIQKWCNEKHHINEWTFKELKKLSSIQKELISIGTVGDGHIDRREDQPMYIEVHAENQKDYMFWKYSFLKDICTKPPVEVKEKDSRFPNGRIYHCQRQWRLNSRIVFDLKSIREMSRFDKVKDLSLFQFALLMLDDGNREVSNWALCVAAWNENEKNVFINCCKRKFGFNCWLQSDVRYITFDAPSSREIDKSILSIVPNELDIIQEKILSRKNKGSAA